MLTQTDNINNMYELCIFNSNINLELYMVNIIHGLTILLNTLEMLEVKC